MATGDDFTLCDDPTGSDREFGEEKLRSRFLNGSRFHIHFVAPASSERRNSREREAGQNSLVASHSHTHTISFRLILRPFLTLTDNGKTPVVHFWGTTLMIHAVSLHRYPSNCYLQALSNMRESLTL